MSQDFTPAPAEPSRDAYYSEQIAINDFDLKHLLSTPESLVVALKEMEETGASAFPLLDKVISKKLADEARRVEFRTCRKQIGEGERAVFQDFSIALNFPDNPVFNELTAAFERQINKAFALIDPSPMPLPFYFNDQAMMMYEAGSEGITPHRDHVNFEGIIAILTLEGQADFYICEDRDKTNSRLFKAEPGQMILMRGVNYAGIKERPYHYVENLPEQRIGFGLRFNAKGGPVIFNS